MQQTHLQGEMERLEREMAAKEHALRSMSQHAALKQKWVLVVVYDNLQYLLSVLLGRPRSMRC